MKINLRACLLVVFLGLLFGNSVQAVGVGVKPKEIDLSVKAGQETVTEFLVMNVDKVPAMYKVSLDAMEDKIKINITDFVLEPNESKIVKVAVKIESPGRFSTNISVVARPLGAGGLTAASGVKVPITIAVSGIPFWLIVLGAVIVICLIVIFVVKLNKGRNKKNHHEITS